MKVPSYCYISVYPAPALKDNGEKQFHKTVSAILMAMKRLVPELPIPYPFDIMSSRRIVTIAAKTN